jgi:predicted nucleic acid-binding Zn ribbon protein
MGSGRREARDVMLFTLLVLALIVVIFFVVGYMVGSAIL